ncbi:MAG TPA: zinc ribbon domain-containing protein [Salegentibacter sp.]|uniref:zinc ribbon domain-containing protein n=1 Tax=Salegentibacter sp. TaxID=1903072 RepID=UPI002F9489E5
MIVNTCQSCGLAFTKERSGTNRDKTLNSDYCIDCFKDGEFTNPHLSLHQLEIQLLEMAEIHNDISLEEAQQIIRKLPELKRWRMENI